MAFNVITAALLGALHLSQIAIGMLGVLAVTGEYSSGMIRATLAAVPQRRLLLAAKALVLTAAVAVTGIAACLAAYLAFQAFLPAGDGMRTTLADPGVLRAVSGAGLYHRAGPARLRPRRHPAVQRRRGGGPVRRAVRTTLLVALLPSPWQDTVGRYLPMNAGDTIYTVHPESHMLRPWTGFGVFCLYAAAALAAGFVLIGRCDA